MGLLRVCFFLSLAGCSFSPALDGLYHCGGSGGCPPGLLCDTDGICRDSDGGLGAPDLTSLADHEDFASLHCVPKMCGPMLRCGEAPDGCGSVVSCGSCPGNGNMVCGVGGPNQCGKGTCKPVTCAELAATCGLVSDGCSAALSCGACGPHQTCDGANHCS